VTVRSHGYHLGDSAEVPIGEPTAAPRRRESWADVAPWQPTLHGYDWDDPPTEPLPVIPPVPPSPTSRPAPRPVVPDWSRLPPAQPYLPSPAFLPASEIDVASDDVLTDETLVRHERATPTEGWRLALYAASGGRINRAGARRRPPGWS
jgi:hypothetical protein